CFIGWARMGHGRRTLGQRVEAVVGVMRSRDLRRLQLGWAAYFLVDGIAMVGLAVWAFRRGGTSAVGVVGLCRLLPGALALPFGAWAADRFPRRRVVTLVFLVIAATQLAIAAALASEAPAAVIYVLIALNSIAGTPYRPAHLALAPLVARSPAELVAMNVTAGTLEGVVTFLGPALAAVLLLGLDPWFVLAAASLAALGGLRAVATITVDVDPSKAVRRAHDRPRAALMGGLIELRHNVDMAVIVGCFVAQILIRGVLGVLLVSVSFDLIHLGSSGVGWLAAAMGIGGIVGAVYAVTLTGHRRLARPFVLALILWGLPITVVGLFPHTVVAFAALLTIGIGNAILDVSGFTLIQRLGIDRTLGRVFGVLYTFGIAMGGLGSLAAPALISWLGLRSVLIAVGLVLPVLALALLSRFRSIDDHSEPLPEVLALLTRVPLLSPLPPTTLEKLAARSDTAENVAGDTIVAEGDPGELFYVIADGEVEVSRGGRSVGTLGPGDQFGEIALLRSTSRTATVVATGPTRLITIDGADFVDALSSSEVAFSIGWSMTDDLLGRDQTEQSS
ncbi:MAG: MFS transporter, partial [Ilumatobacteraceae bacterium]